jgi:sugar phosphate isomerase/epimerase
MLRPLALHQITAMALDPAGLVALAAQTGCDGVCVFTHVPESAAGAGFPAVTPTNKAAMLSAMVSHNVAVTNVEFFPITKDVVVGDFAAGLALGAELGATRAVCHIHDTDAARAVDRMGQLADLAASKGLGLGLEFMPMTPGCPDIHRAAWFIDQIARANLGVAVDMLHLVRSGGTAADVAAMDARYFAYAQICDGKGLHADDNYLPEALSREQPGVGDFPMVEILEALPFACALDVEVPNSRNVIASEWAAEAVTRSRALIARATFTR